MNFTRTKLRLFVPLMLCWAWSGCASYRDQPLSAEQAANDFAARTLHDPELAQFIALNSPGSHFDATANTWTFAQLTLAAIYYQPELAVKRAQFAISQAGSESAAERPNPSLGLNPGYNASATDVTPWIMGLTFDIPLETAGKRRYRVAQADAVMQAAGFDLASSAWVIRSALRQATYEWHAARKRQEYKKHIADLVEQRYHVLEQGVSAGGITNNELSLAQVELAQATLDLREQDGQVQRARTQLSKAIGVPLTALNDITLSEDVATESLISELAARRVALLTRPDILSALATYQATQHALQLEIAKQYPDVHLSPGYTYDQGENKWELGLSLSLPIFNQNQGAIANAKAQRDEQAARFIALQASISAEIDSAYLSYQQTQQTLAMAQRVHHSTIDQQQTIVQQVAQGLLPAHSASAAALEIVRVQQRLLEFQLTQQQALIAIEDAIQQSSDGQPPPWQMTPTLITNQTTGSAP